MDTVSFCGAPELADVLSLLRKYWTMTDFPRQGQSRAPLKNRAQQDLLGAAPPEEGESCAEHSQVFTLQIYPSDKLLPWGRANKEVKDLRVSTDGVPSTEKKYQK